MLLFGVSCFPSRILTQERPRATPAALQATSVGRTFTRGKLIVTILGLSDQSAEDYSRR
jgi:hypothetical protein